MDRIKRATVSYEEGTRGDEIVRRRMKQLEKHTVRTAGDNALAAKIIDFIPVLIAKLPNAKSGAEASYDALRSSGMVSEQPEDEEGTSIPVDGSHPGWDSVKHCPLKQNLAKPFEDDQLLDFETELLSAERRGDKIRRRRNTLANNQHILSDVSCTMRQQTLGVTNEESSSPWPR